MSTKQGAQFPKKFLWGAAMSAHQVEGNTHNQWSVWELENAKSLATQAEYHYADTRRWSTIAKQAKSPANYISGAASGHYDRYEYDIAIAAKLNMNALRFSVEWSRVEPEEGAWNAEAIEHYKTYVTTMKDRGIEPILTLFHFTLPVWFAERGGFEHRKNIQYFVRFAEKIVSELGVNVRYVITINEPEVYVSESYLNGHWPPMLLSKRTALRVYRNLAHAHNQTARVVHGLNRRYKVSIAKNTAFMYAGDDALLSRKTADFMQYIQDDYFLKKVVKHCDFIGVNYYMSNRVYGYRVHNPDERMSDLGWDMQPASIQFALERLHDKYGLPLMVTENGLADADDEDRKWWIAQTIAGMQRAIEGGVSLLGYMHWSLLDNFEWDKGRWPRFGLVEVNYPGLERKVRKSAVWYGAVIKKLRG